MFAKFITCCMVLFAMSWGIDAQAQQVPTVFFPPITYTMPNAEFMIDLKGADFDALSGFGVTIAWDTTKLSLTNVASGDFLSITPGQVGNGCTLSWIGDGGNNQSVSNPTTFGTFKFKALAGLVDSTEVLITTMELYKNIDNEPNLLQANAQSGSIIIKNCPNDWFQIPAPDTITHCPGIPAEISINCAECDSIWVNDTLITSTPAVIVLDADKMYHIQAKTQDGCLGIDSIVYKTLPRILQSAQDTTVMLCPGDSISLSPRVVDGSVFNWNTNATAPHISINTAGTYSVTITNNDTAAVCEESTTATYTVKQALKPEVIVADTVSVCTGGTVVVCVVNSQSDWRYKWINSAVTDSCLLVSDTVTSQTLIVANADGCSDTATIALQKVALPVILMPSDTLVCPDALIGPSNPGIGTYRWSPTDSTQSITVHTPGPYTLTVTDTTRGCSSSATIVVAFEQASITTLTVMPAGAICPGTPIQLTFGGVVDTFYWIKRTMLFPFGQLNTIVDTLTQTDTIGVVWTNGCLTDTVWETIPILPIAANLGEDKMIPPLDSAEICNTPDSAQTDCSYTWSSTPTDTTLQTPSTSCITVYPDVATIYTLVVKDTVHGCTSTDTLLVKVAEAIRINAFTPNGDGINDVLELNEIRTRMPGLFLPNDLIVWDNWGNTVLEATNYQNDWDGTLAGQGSPLAEDTYFMCLRYGDGQSKKTIHNTITIKR